MAKKELRVSVNEFEKAIGKPRVTEVEFGDVTILAKETLSLEEMMGFVNDVVVSCFDENGQYMPEGFSFSMRLGILSRYGNVTLPKDLSKRYMFAQSEAVEAIMGFINLEQLSEIEKAAEDKIDYLVETNVSAVMQDLSKLGEAINRIGEMMPDGLEDVSKDEISAILSGMANGVSEEKLVAAMAKNGGMAAL